MPDRRDAENTRRRTHRTLYHAVMLCLLAISGIEAQTLGEISSIQATNASELLDAVDQALFPESFVATLRMTTERPGRRETEMLMNNSHLEGSGTFMEVREPSRSRGMRFLQKGEDLWMYNPRSGARRAIRLSPRDSFQGSVFSNSDVSDPDYNDDYQARHLGAGLIDHPDLGRIEAAVIRAEAVTDAASYGWIDMWIVAGPGGPLPLRFDYVSRSGLPFKQMILSSFEQLAGGLRPRTMRMEALDEQGAATTVYLEALEATENIPLRLFNQQELSR